MKSSMLHDGEEALWVAAQYLGFGVVLSFGHLCLVRRHIVNTCVGAERVSSYRGGAVHAT